MNERTDPFSLPEECPFCAAYRDGKTGLTVQGKWRESPILGETEHFFITYDLFPVTEGHMLIITKKHARDLHDIVGQEWSNLRTAIQMAMNIAGLEEHVDEVYTGGFNIGINCGEIAGQTVMHFHCHVFPRRKGDVENPKGGIRNFKKPIVPY